MANPPITCSIPTISVLLHLYLLPQNLIMYGTFKLAQRQPGGEKMVGLVRILALPTLAMLHGAAARNTVQQHHWPCGLWDVWMMPE